MDTNCLLTEKQAMKSASEEARRNDSANGGVEESVQRNGNIDDLLVDSRTRARASKKSGNAKDQEFDTLGQELGTSSHPVLQKINDFRGFCGDIVNDSRTQFVIVILISINAIMMGIGTYDFIRENQRLDNLFETVDLVFLIIFTIELSLQFIHHGWRLLLDGWLVFDLVVISTSWYFSGLQIIRAFRIFRALRLVTRIKVMKNLILAIFGVVPRMAAIGVMLMIIFYIFAVMCTSLFGELHLDGQENQTEFNYFGSMGWSLFTLFQFMTLDEWGDVCRQIMEIYQWSWIPFIAFIIISSFIMVNLMIAVICDAIRNLHKEERARLQGRHSSQCSDSSHPIEIREQLDSLEEQMEELTRIQARTFHALQYMTRQMQMQKLKQEMLPRGDVSDDARDLREDQERNERNFLSDDSSQYSKSRGVDNGNGSQTISQKFGDGGSTSLDKEQGQSATKC